MPKVSVVIVCMNRPDLLYPCLEGIRAHTSVSYDVLCAGNLDVGVALLGIDSQPGLCTGLANLGDGYNLILFK